jgi:hypothetical protein
VLDDELRLQSRPPIQPREATRRQSPPPRPHPQSPGQTLDRHGLAQQPKREPGTGRALLKRACVWISEAH